jgi:hypothetical protein
MVVDHHDGSMPFHLHQFDAELIGVLQSDQLLQIPHDDPLCQCEMQVHLIDSMGGE